MYLDLTATLIGLTLAAALFALAAWRTSRPYDPLKGKSAVPWTLIAITAGAVALFMVVHLMNLAGIETGQGRSPV